MSPLPLIFLLLPLFFIGVQAQIPFTDVTKAAGITQPNAPEQFGGPTIADLDNDGHYDLVLTYHNRDSLRIFYGSASGKFTRKAFSLRTDAHGVSVAPRSALSAEKLLTVSAGGGRGTNPRPPFVFLTKPDRSFTDITNKFGLGTEKSRGRVAVFMDMALKSNAERKLNGGGPDVLFVNLLGTKSALSHFAYENVKGGYELRKPKNFERINEERAIVTDIDNDGVMELVNFSVFGMYKLTGPFTFKDISNTVAKNMRRLSRTISAVVELDFNNDGKMDLYVARANSNVVTPRGPANFPKTTDVLLKNVGGKYEDVTGKYDIPKLTNSMGVSAEDFNNDGWVDVIVTTFEGADFLLMNNAGKGFTKVELGSVSKPANTRGHNVMAVDYNGDGRMDFIVSQGFRKAVKGQYKLMKSGLALGAGARYLHVRVGSAADGSVSALNALVSVQAGGLKMVRRVGGRGAQSGGQSLIDTVHFGLGSASKVDKVTVKWTTGTTETKTGVAVDSKVMFGKGL